MDIQKAKEELKQYLTSLSILTLRTLAREIGVYNPTKTSKESLIAQSVSILVGETAPSRPSRRGAPVKEASLDQKYMREIKAICNRYLTEKTLIKNSMGVRSPERPSLRPVRVSPYDLPVYRGVLEYLMNGCGSICENIEDSSVGEGVFVPAQFIRENDLREGDYIVCTAVRKEQDRNPVIEEVLTVNGNKPFYSRHSIDTLSVIYPQEKINFSDSIKTQFLRLVDLFVPVARGQRVLMETPTGVEALMVLRELTYAVKMLSETSEYNDLHPLALLLEQRPEEFDEFSFLPEYDRVCTGFDDDMEKHFRASHLLFNRAARIAENGEHAILFVDSLTKLGRFCLSSENTEEEKKDKVTSENAPLNFLKQGFLLAGNFKEGGSITIIAVANNDSQNSSDRRIYRMFEQIANSHIVLSRLLARSHISPAVDLRNSYTEREERFLTPEELESVCLARENLQGDGREILKIFRESSDAETFLKELKERYV